GILMVLKRQLQASITVQSLDGLGCTIALVLPVATVTPLNQNRLAHLLLFDNQPGSLSERAQSLAPLTEYLAKCSDLAELQQKSKQFAYEIALIMLPEPAELSQWCNELQELCRRSRVLCYAAKAQLAVWREALQLPVQEIPFCLEDVLSARPAQIQYPRLLVVDDNATNLAFIRVLMKEQPVQLYTANCGQEALKLCQQQLFDVILLDIQLPDIAGTEVAQQLRQLAEYQHTPILAFTAHALEDEVNAFIRAGMNDVIFKPLEATKVELILRWCSVGKTDDISQ
ncbi:MAG TPA: response regulator, partial [Rheinheimera sp.]|nr:response regulator [Rheinheimera sp.]